jgi:methylmalonyl-CoA/ethylmalonyl-CoA epimerase
MTATADPAPAATAVRLSEIGQIAVYVDDVDRAVRFYRDTLGLPFLFQVPPGLAFFMCGGVRLMLDKPAREHNGHRLNSSSILYYKVPDITAAYQSLTAKGVEFEGEPHCIAQMDDHDLWMAFFQDTEGNTLALMCEVREGRQQ